MGTYIVEIEDLFRVEAESERKAKEKVLNRIGEGSWICKKAKVIDVEE